MNAKLIMWMEDVRDFFKREDGASAIEYALIAGLIAVAIIGGAGALGGGVNELFNDIKDVLTGVDTSGGDSSGG